MFAGGIERDQCHELGKSAVHVAQSFSDAN